MRRSNNQNRRRNNNRRNQQVSTIVHSAFKREHGFVSKGGRPDPPTYKENPIINFKQRVTLRTVADSDITFGINDILTGSIFREYKILNIQAWANSQEAGVTAGLLDSLNLTYEQQGETWKANDIAAKNRHAHVKIFPPQDDWQVKSVSDSNITVNCGVLTSEVTIDISLKARISTPVVNYSPPAENITVIETPIHSFRKEEEFPEPYTSIHTPV